MSDKTFIRLLKEEITDQSQLDLHAFDDEDQRYELWSTVNVPTVRCPMVMNEWIKLANGNTSTGVHSIPGVDIDINTKKIKFPINSNYDLLTETKSHITLPLIEVKDELRDKVQVRWTASVANHVIVGYAFEVHDNVICDTNSRELNVRHNVLSSAPLATYLRDHEMLGNKPESSTFTHKIEPQHLRVFLNIMYNPNNPLRLFDLDNAFKKSLSHLPLSLRTLT